MKSIRHAYQTLHRRFGHQGWWPTTPVNSPKPVYTPRKSLHRLSEQDRFEICLGAFLTQNTNWGNVVQVLSLLQSKRALKYEAFRRLPRSRMEKYLKSSGYFRQKTSRVRDFLKRVESVAGGRFSSFFSGKLPALRKRLLDLKGIGPETADSMLLYSAGRPIFVIDAYTRRIGTRWGILKGRETYDEIQKIFMSALPRSARVYGEFHALLVKLAVEFCRKKPLCSDCPVRKDCATGKKGEIS